MFVSIDRLTFLSKTNLWNGAQIRPHTETIHFTYVAVSGKAKCLPRYGHIQKLYTSRMWPYLGKRNAYPDTATYVKCGTGYADTATCPTHIETIPLYFLLFSSHSLRYSLNSLFTCFSSFLVNDHNFPDCLGALMMASTQSFSTSPRSSFPHFHLWP